MAQRKPPEDPLGPVGAATEAPPERKKPVFPKVTSGHGVDIAAIQALEPCERYKCQMTEEEWDAIHSDDPFSVFDLRNQPRPPLPKRLEDHPVDPEFKDGKGPMPRRWGPRNQYVNNQLVRFKNPCKRWMVEIGFVQQGQACCLGCLSNRTGLSDEEVEEVKSDA